MTENEWEMGEVEPHAPLGGIDPKAALVSELVN